MKEEFVKDETVSGSKVEVSRSELHAPDSCCPINFCSVQ